MRDTENEIFQLRNEISGLVRICEDVLREKVNLFPGSSVGALANAIVDHNRPEATPFMDQFIFHIRSEYRTGNLDASALQSIGFVLEKIGYVDREWYLRVNPDVAKQNKLPGEHYVMWGHEENRKPNQFT